MKDIKSYIEGLTKREKNLALATSAFVILMILWLVISSVAGGISARRKRVELTDRNLAELKNLAEEYRTIEGALGELEARIKGGSQGSVLGALENIADKSGVKENVIEMKPKQVTSDDPSLKESAIEVKLAAVDVKALAGFLIEIENASEFLKVKKIRITPKGEGEEKSLDAVIQVSSFEAAK